MVKRKCGTCRHFKDGGVAGSGWCQHPARKDIQQMVLVRKTELACRNSWDQDLWEVADQPFDIHTSADIPMPLSGGDARDIPMARTDVPADDVVRAGEMFTDRMTSISMPTRSQLRPGRRDADHAIDDLDDADLAGARSSVREARRRRMEQRFQERKRRQETIIKRPDDVLDTGKPADDVDRGLTKVRATDGPLTSTHDQRPTPPLARDQPRKQAPVNREPEQSIQPVPAIEFRAVPPRFREERKQPAPVPDSTLSDSPHRAPLSNGAEKPAAIDHSHTEPFPAAVVRDAVRRELVDTRSEPSGLDPRRRAPGPALSAKAKSEASRTAGRTDLPPAVEERPTTWYTGAGHIPQPDIASDIQAPYAVDPIDLSHELQSVRRCCATCRDFRQVGDGRTGWCNNPYAFSERRMVQSSEIACRSSLGVWWLPHDDLWLERADTTHHGRPTPLLDDAGRAVSAGRQGAGQRSS